MVRSAHWEQKAVLLAPGDVGRSEEIVDIEVSHHRERFRREAVDWRRFVIDIYLSAQNRDCREHALFKRSRLEQRVDQTNFVEWREGVSGSDTTRP